MKQANKHSNSAPSDHPCSTRPRPSYRTTEPQPSRFSPAVATRPVGFHQPPSLPLTTANSNYSAPKPPDSSPSAQPEPLRRTATNQTGQSSHPRSAETEQPTVTPATNQATASQLNTVGLPCNLSTTQSRRPSQLHRGSPPARDQQRTEQQPAARHLPQPNRTNFPAAR